ncbi:hypothetical protein HS048_09760 [Planomonospora sp. ID91781]|uniref:Membrane protein n=3 Tax=Planomonospora TaxID=1998 RepID=A0A171BKK4_9ACTN|nr:MULTISPECIES: hypothetical protein [Planomonospora]MBG0821020.1 hypothetical protein [Planomonospora sp. ID91781]GAT65235.1 membrane protein [Planomonospora sphaerica]GGK57985.1 hypothetical protein GCM10010126_16890 [Planomonospora parontospora]GGL08590.1 hypothetical protein GCM10014719_08250 [Planomonospora parontospora subsp. antibiotica]GII07836.1 hypothetical protein Ppa06_16340 [Planomonospora parontospora subsp. parontospora]
MSCDDLVCARCAHPVAEGRCPLCRANRDRMHQAGLGGMTPAMVSLALIVLFFLTLVLEHLAKG